MPNDIFVKNLDRLQIIALLTIIIDGTKLSVAVSDIFTGHLQYLDSVMKRGNYYLKIQKHPFFFLSIFIFSQNGGLQNSDLFVYVNIHRISFSILKVLIFDSYINPNDL